MKHKKLLIISHTEHYLNAEQQIVGLGSTVNEINYLANFWEDVVHVGCLYKEKAPEIALPYTKNNIRFVPILPFGGKTVFDKIGILFKIPNIISAVIKNQKNVSEVQLRLPTSMGLFLLPLFSFLLSRKYTFWVKYAGNWKQVAPPLSYKLQRWWLKNNFAKCKVTINGFWDNQPQHCYSFENPCLSLAAFTKGKGVTNDKNFRDKFNLIFIGRLDDTKGVSIILKALQNVDLTKIDKIHIIGDSDQRNFYQEKASFLKEKIVFYGFLSTEKVHQLLQESHFLLLPSKSEGFPKVIAEAACYGVIPIVSDVGSITHYINETNGFVWNINSATTFETVLNVAFKTAPQKLAQLSENILSVAEMFTFENYRAKLEKYILKNDRN